MVDFPCLEELDRVYHAARTQFVVLRRMVETCEYVEPTLMGNLPQAIHWCQDVYIYEPDLTDEQREVIRRYVKAAMAALTSVAG